VRRYSMAPKPKAIEQRSQATPFAEQFLDQLMGNLSSGYATGLQRNAGTAIEQYANSIKPFDMTDTFKAMTEMFGNQNRTAAANIREGMSGAGNRYGSAAATGEGRFYAEALPAQQAMMGELGLRSYDSFNRAKLGGMQLYGQNANEALRPFLQMALAGVHPDQIMMQENPWMTGLKTLGGVAAGAGAALTGLGPLGAGIIGGAGGGAVPWDFLPTSNGQWG
jgi:hypothetical protein